MQRPSSHQPSSDGSELGSARFGPSFTKLPLLPYERALIASIGITEDEYEDYLKYVQKKSQIPVGTVTASAIVVPSLILLAVGALFTVAGVLLAPKPKAPKDGPRIRSKQGDSERGRTRFSPTFGFDTQTELGEYGTSIPIHFGKQEKNSQRNAVRSNWPVTYDQLFCSDYVRYTPGPNRSGGMVISPVLIHSRMFSLGRGQLFHGMYVVGEQMNNGEIPELGGIWLGNNTLDKMAEQNFAFYWDNEGNEGRLRKVDLRYGTHNEDASGNPFLAPIIPGYRDWAEPFPTPLCNRADGSGFCMAYSLSNQSTFGCYSPIMNGVDRRPNWRVISLPKDSDKNAEERTKLERQKISGGEDRMEGTGRGYGRLMGLVEYNGARNGSRSNPRWTAPVMKGDRVRFNIVKRRYDEDLYKDSFKDDGERFTVNVSVEDLVNESEADRAAADDALQLGEEFMINKTRFRVVERKNEPFDMTREDFAGTASYAILECIEQRNPFLFEIGFVSSDYFNQDIPKKASRYSIFANDHVPPHWSPLLKYEIGSFRNLRVAEVTEIGIKSRVYAQMNGMCNFPTIPTPNELRDDFDKQNVTFQNGVQSQYFARYSFFMLHLRDTWDKDLSDPLTFRDTKQIFAVKGTEPVDQYNYIAIKPEIRRQYEYRLYPLNSGMISRLPEDATAWLLDAANGNEFKVRPVVAEYGGFEISGAGHLININCVKTSPLMLGKRDSDYSDDGDAFCPITNCPVEAPADEWSPGDYDYANTSECPETPPAPAPRPFSPYNYAAWRVILYPSYGLMWSVFGGDPSATNTDPLIFGSPSMTFIPVIMNQWFGWAPFGPTNADDAPPWKVNFNLTKDESQGATVNIFGIYKKYVDINRYDGVSHNGVNNVGGYIWYTNTSEQGPFYDTIDEIGITGTIKLYNTVEDYNNDANAVLWEGV